MKIESIDLHNDLIIVTLVNTFSENQDLVLTLTDKLEVTTIQNDSNLMGLDLVNEIRTVKIHLKEIMSAY